MLGSYNRARVAAGENDSVNGNHFEKHQKRYKRAARFPSVGRAHSLIIVTDD